MTVAKPKIFNSEIMQKNTIKVKKGSKLCMVVGLTVLQGIDCSKTK
jgi:hypothetical protein